MTDFTNIAVAYGDGIGPEIMESVLRILRDAGAQLKIETIEIGEKLYLRGQPSGISKEAWDTIHKTKILLKAPITTPQGKGYKSLNVTFRKTLGLFANIRPAVSYYPFVDSKQEKMDLIVFRENEEDLYAGIEYKVSPTYNLSYKLITHKGSEKIIRYAFEYAKTNNRKKVTCLIKDNIMKIADGAFHNIFDTVAKEYPDIKADAMIVDIGSARIASRPQDFDVIVTLNLYGDIISDIAAEVSGSVGLAGSSNIGPTCAMFEAVHGSAPDIAGKGIANPSGLLNGAVMMLDYIGQGKVGALIQNAWLKTLEDGVHTGDIYKEGKSKVKASTSEFTDAVINNLGKSPSHLPAKTPASAERIKVNLAPEDKKTQELVGADIYIDAHTMSIAETAALMESLSPNLQLYTISLKGLKVWPHPDATAKADEYTCCRYIGYKDKGVTQDDITALISKVSDKKVAISTVQNLYNYAGNAGYSMAQGE
jgi:isocitrate dehydrogenase